MKRMFLKSLLLSLMFFRAPYLQTGEPGTFGHISEPELPSTGLITNHTHLPEEHLSEEALRLEHIQQAEDLQRLLTQKHLTQDPLLPHVIKQGNAEGTSLLLVPAGKDTTTDDDLTAKERAALKAEELHSFNTTASTDTEHLTNHHTPLNFIRTKIIQHLTNELATIKSKLTTEQIKNREMVIKFFDKAGELTKENLKEFHTIYEKLAQWKEGTELTLTPDEQKKMKLFLQSIVTTYCVKHQTIEKAL